MRKEKIQGRVEEESLNLLRIIGKMLNLNSDSEIINYMVTNTIEKNKNLLKRYNEMFIPKHVTENTWVECGDSKWVRWKFIALARVKVEIFEVFSDLDVNHQEVTLPLMFDEIRENFNKLGLVCGNLDENRCLCDEEYKEDEYESEKILLLEYTIAYGGENIFYSYIECSEDKDLMRDQINDYMMALNIVGSISW